MKIILSSLAVLALLASAAGAAARGPIVCIAASKESDAKVPLTDVGSLEFYADEGDPLQSYSVPLTRVTSNPDSAGHLQNTYSVNNPKAVGATIVFSGMTPLSFTVVELGRTYTSLSKNDEETAFMADAVPGIACYSVTVASEPL